MASYGTLRYRFVIFRNQFEFKDPRLPSDHVRYRRKASGSSNIWVYCEEFLTVPVINIYQDEPGKRRAQSSCARCRLMGWAPNAGYLPQSVYKNLCGFWSLSGLASEKGHPWFSQDVAEQSIKFRQSFIFVWMGIEGTVHFFNSRSARALICFHAVIIKIYERSLLCSNYSRSRPPVTVIRTHTNALTLGTLPPMHDLTIGSRATVTDIESCMSPSMGRRLLRTKGAHTHDSGRQCKQDTNGHQIAETDQSYSLKKKKWRSWVRVQTGPDPNFVHFRIPQYHLHLSYPESRIRITRYSIFVVGIFQNSPRITDCGSVKRELAILYWNGLEAIITTFTSVLAISWTENDL